MTGKDRNKYKVEKKSKWKEEEEKIYKNRHKELSQLQRAPVNVHSHAGKTINPGTSNFSSVKAIR